MAVGGDVVYGWQRLRARFNVARAHRAGRVLSDSSSTIHVAVVTERRPAHFIKCQQTQSCRANARHCAEAGN